MVHEKRKLPRFHITPCQFHDESLGKTIAVHDLSPGGLSLRLTDESDLAAFPVSSIHSGIVKISGRKFPCRIRVRNFRGVLVGAEWESPSSELSVQLREVSQPERLGENLRRYEIQDLNASDWFHNPVGVDLLVYPGGDKNPGPSRWMLYIHRNFIQWESETGVQTGQTLAEADEGYSHGVVRIETRLIEYDARVDFGLIRAAQELVRHAPIGDAELKQMVLSQLISQLNGVV